MKSIALLVGGLIVVIVAGWWLLAGSDADRTDESAVAVGAVGNPNDIVTDFYIDWLNAVQSTTTDPVAAGLATAAYLAPPVREAIAAAGMSATVDPVLCQETVPAQVSVREIYVNETAAQYLVIGRGPERTSLAGQATVTMAGSDGAWTIERIECGFGEAAPEQEDDLAREGFLLRSSLPDTFDKQYWYLVYEQDGRAGFTVPLLFTDTSICGTADQPAACDQSQLSEALPVRVVGEMTEAGLAVQTFTILTE